MGCLNWRGSAGSICVSNAAHLQLNDERTHSKLQRWTLSLNPPETTAGSDPETAAYVRRLLDGEPVFESCLVDTWVSEGRYAWVDLRCKQAPPSPIPLSAGGNAPLTKRSFPLSKLGAASCSKPSFSPSLIATP
jgi:hypothetical protein